MSNRLRAASLSTSTAASTLSLSTQRLLCGRSPTTGPLPLGLSLVDLILSMTKSTCTGPRPQAMRFLLGVFLPLSHLSMPIVTPNPVVPCPLRPSHKNMLALNPRGSTIPVRRAYALSKPSATNLFLQATSESPLHLHI